MEGKNGGGNYDIDLNETSLYIYVAWVIHDEVWYLLCFFYPSLFFISFH